MSGPSAPSYLRHYFLVQCDIAIDVLHDLENGPKNLVRSIFPFHCQYSKDVLYAPDLIDSIRSLREVGSHLAEYEELLPLFEYIDPEWDNECATILAAEQGVNSDDLNTVVAVYRDVYAILGDWKDDRDQLANSRSKSGKRLMDLGHEAKYLRALASDLGILAAKGRVLNARGAGFSLRKPEHRRLKSEFANSAHQVIEARYLELGRVHCGQSASPFAFLKLDAYESQRSRLLRADIVPAARAIPGTKDLVRQVLELFDKVCRECADLESEWRAADEQVNRAHAVRRQLASVVDRRKLEELKRILENVAIYKVVGAIEEAMK